MEGGGEGGKVRKMQKKHEKGDPPPKNLAKTPRTTPTHSGFPTTVHLL